MFPRGEGPLVSVLIPTRGRPKMLCEAIDSLYSLCNNKSNVEFILRVDADDIETMNVSIKLAESLPVKIIVAARGAGYLAAHTWYNEMCALASGDWIFIYNDDVLMKSNDWDQIILRIDPYEVYGWKGCYDVCTIGTYIEGRHMSWEMPLIRRKIFDIIGHVSLFAWNDSWIYNISKGAKCLIMIEQLKLNHQIFNIDDKTKVEGRDKNIQYSQDELDIAINNDVVKLVDYVRNYKIR